MALDAERLQLIHETIEYIRGDATWTKPASSQDLIRIVDAIATGKPVVFYHYRYKAVQKLRANAEIWHRLQWFVKVKEMYA